MWWRGSALLHRNAAVYRDNNVLNTFILHEMQARGIPGVAIAFVKDGAIHYVQGYSLDPQQPISADSRFQLASVSKPLTAWGIMWLAERGEIELDAPAQDYLQRWSFPPSAYDVTGVSVRRLLSHTAGVSVSGYAGFPPDTVPHTLEQLLRAAVDVPTW